MHTAIPFEGGELEAQLAGEFWIVRLGELEARSKWLDFALSRLLDDTQKAHELAAKLVEQLLPDDEAQAAAAGGRGVTNGARPGPGPVTKPS